jgi:hypothetical protein
MAPQNQEDSTSIKTNGTTSRYDYHYLLQRVDEEGKKIYGPCFKIADIDKPVIRRLLVYVLRDDVEAQQEGIDFHKGILLTGSVGCGKTSLMQILKNLSNESFKPVIKSCREISIEFGKKGYEMISRYTTNAFHPYSSIPRAYCFDDLGLETTVNFWGDKCNAMVEILLSRYDLFISHKMITRATTNLNGNELEEMYGNQC